MSSGRRSRSRRHRRSGRRLVLALLLIAAATVAIIALSKVLRPGQTPAEPGKAAAPVAVSLQFNAPLGPAFAGEIVAREAGLFGQANIDPKLIAGRSDSETIDAVAKGRSMVGIVDPVSFLIARSKGAPVVAFAADYVESATVFYALAQNGVAFAQAKSSISAPEDFAGRKVGRTSGTREALFYDALLNLRGVSRSDVRESDKNVDIDGLLSGAIEVLPGRLGVEDYALKSRGASYRTIRLFDFGIHVPDYVYIAAEKTVRDHPSVLARLVGGAVAGWNRTYANVDRASRTLAEAGAATSAEEAAYKLGTQRDFVITVGRRIMEYDPQQWKQLAQILANARQLDEYFDLARAVNYDILKDAYRKPISFGNELGPEPTPILGR